MTQTIMEKEAKQTPSVIENQLKSNQELVASVGEKLRQFDPKMVMIIGIVIKGILFFIINE